MKKLGIIISILLLVVSCAKNDIDELGSIPQGELIEVALDLNIDGLTPATEQAQEAATRATSEESVNLETQPSTDIKTLLVVQASDEYILHTHFIDDFSSSSSTSVNIVTSEENCTFYYFANIPNTGLGLNVGDSASEIAELYKAITKKEDCLYEVDGVYYWTMSGSQEIDEAITSASDVQLSCSLKRIAARVKITVKHSLGADFVINSIRLSNVPSQMNYSPNVDLSSDYPTLQETDYISYPIFNISSTDESTSQEANLITYLPTNCRTPKTAAANNTDEAQKNKYANDLSTFATINVSRTTEEEGGEAKTELLSYKVYLGENLTSNFNIKANCNYEYTFSFNSTDDLTGEDSRFTNLGLIDVDYTNLESSNCYILNPSGVERTFRIPVKDRINTFWDSSNNYCTEDQTNSNMLTDGENWKTEILWYDGVSIDGFNASPNTADGSMTITLPANFNPSNIVVAVRSVDADNKESDILWSWHLWVTDYNPYQTPTQFGDNEYVYTVGNGNIHKYQGTLWQDDGIYKDCYIMDREIGAQSTTYSDNYGSTALMYEYGRKDPFVGTNVKFTKSEYGRGNSDDPVLVMSGEAKSLDYAVKNPTHYIVASDGSGKWYNTPESPSFQTYNWFDHKVTCDATTGITTGKDGKYKSIFDPSPLGWCVPVRTTWEGFVQDNFEDDPSSVGRRLVYCDNALFSYLGCRGGSNGKYYDDEGRAGRLWASSPDISSSDAVDYKSSSIIYYKAGETNGSINPDNIQLHATGRNIRPVLDKGGYYYRLLNSK